MKPIPNRFVRQTLAAILGFGVHSAQQVSAAALTWDADNATAGAQDGSNIAGDIWGVAGQLGNWRNTTTPTDNVDWVANDTATFGAGTDGTYAITVGGAISATAINFVNSGYTLSASSAQVITVGAGNALSVSSGKSATIGANVTVTRNGGFNAVGGGTLFITGTGATVSNTSNNSFLINNGTTIEVGTGGLFSNTGGVASSIVVGNDATNGATLHVNGGTVTTSGNLAIANNNGSGVITLTTGAINQTATGLATRFGGTTSTGTFNLNGGTLTTARIFEQAAGVSSTFNFDGGTLKVTFGSTNAGNFMTVDNANVRAGGAKIDTNGVATTISQILRSGVAGPALDGGLTLNDTAVSKSTLTLSGANDYTGLTTVTAGALSISSTGSIRSGNALTVASGGTANFANVGQTLGAVSNANTTANALNFSAATGTVTLGSLSGAGNTRFGSNGTVTGGISQGSVNAVGLLTANISGGTVGAGTLSSTTISGGTTTVSGIATIGTLSSGTANLNGTSSSITNLNGGTVNLGSSTVLTVSSGTTAGSITGTGGGFTKTSADTLTLSNTGTYTYTGATNVNAGTLVINGNISTSSLTTVASGATIGGSGTVGALTIQSGGFVNPGNSPGILNTGDYNQAGTLVAEINGLTAGTQHDQLNVSGTVTLSGALSILATGGTYAANNIIFLILNNDIDAVNGTFSGLAQGATAATFGGFDWIISYEANSTGSTFLGGNDVALMAIPESSTALLGGLSTLLLLRRRRLR